MRHFTEELVGVRLLLEDELDLIAGGDGEDTDDNPNPPPIPPGFRPVGDGSKYMQDASGKYYFTPAYEQQVQNIKVDWGGVARDLAWLAGTSVGGVAANIWGLAGGIVAAGIDTWKQLNPQPNH